MTVVGASTEVAGEGGTAANDPITVFVASGMLSPMETIAARYEARTGQKVLLNAGSSSTLARQIAAGAEMDVFISANTEWMDFAEKSGRITSQSRCSIAADRLVLITPAAVESTGDGDAIDRL